MSNIAIVQHSISSTILHSLTQIGGVIGGVVAPSECQRSLLTGRPDKRWDGIVNFSTEVKTDAMKIYRSRYSHMTGISPGSSKSRPIWPVMWATYIKFTCVLCPIRERCARRRISVSMSCWLWDILPASRFRPDCFCGGGQNENRFALGNRPFG